MSSSSFERFFKRVLVASSLVGVFAIVTVLRLDVALAQTSVTYENATPGNSPAQGDIDLVFTLDTSLTLTISDQPTGAPATAMTNTNDINFGQISVTPTGCGTGPTTGGCYSVSDAGSTQVNLVAVLEAQAACGGYSTMGLYIYRNNTPALTGLPTGRVRFVAGALSATTPATPPSPTWTLNITGTAVQETDGATTADGSLSSELIARTTACGTQYVAYHLAARVLSTDTSGSTTPITHRLFAAP